MTTRSLSPETKDQFLQALRACVWFVPRPTTEQVSAVDFFSMTDFESAVREIIQYHQDISEDADIPEDRAMVLEFAECLNGRTFNEILPQLLGLVRAAPPFNDLLMRVKNLPNTGLCSDCVAEQVYRVYLTRRLKASRIKEPDSAFA